MTRLQRTTHNRVAGTVANKTRSLNGAAAGAKSAIRGSSCSTSRCGKAAAASFAPEEDDGSCGVTGSSTGNSAGEASQQQSEAVGSQQAAPESSTTEHNVSCCPDRACANVPAGRSSERSRRRAVRIFTVVLGILEYVGHPDLAKYSCN